MKSLPAKLYRRIRSVTLRVVNPVRYYGQQRFCNVCCGNARLFLPGGEDRRADARCPYCGSLERHRLVMAFFQQRTNLFDGSPMRFLHVAPEYCFARGFRG